MTLSYDALVLCSCAINCHVLVMLIVLGIVGLKLT